MREGINILQSGSIYFFYRPKVGSNEKEVQHFFFVLHPQNQEEYQLLVMGKKHFPFEEKGSYFLFLEAIKKNKNDLLQSLTEKEYMTSTHGKRILPASHCLGVGKFLIAEHGNHTHFIYQLTTPQKNKEIQKEFNLKREDDYLINVKNLNAKTPSGIGLMEEKKANYPLSLQEKFANRRFIPLNPVSFLNYEGAELLLIAIEKKKLIERKEKEINICLEKISSDELLNEFTKIFFPNFLISVNE